LEQKGALSRLQGSLVEGTLFHPPGATTNSISNTNNSGEGVAASTENPLNSFCRRYNQSLLGKVALHERRDTLLEENRMLQVRQRKEVGKNRRESAMIVQKRETSHHQDNLKPLSISFRIYSSPSSSTWTG